MKFKETKKRSLIKSVTFRILIVLVDLMVIYALTRKIMATIAITIFTNISSTIFYFLHERYWNSISWGKQRVR